MDAAATGWIFLATRTGFEPADLLIPAGLTLICLWLMMRYRRNQKRSAHSQHLTVGQQAQRTRETRGMHSDLQHLMVEVEQLAKRFGAQLDAKSIQLEDLIHAADIRIEALQRLASQASDPDHASEPSPATGKREIASPPPPPTVSSTADDLTRRVCTLADAGMPPIENARELDEQVGKVELILSLRDAG